MTQDIQKGREGRGPGLEGWTWPTPAATALEPGATEATRQRRRAWMEVCSNGPSQVLSLHACQGWGWPVCSDRQRDTEQGLRQRREDKGREAGEAAAAKDTGSSAAPPPPATRTRSCLPPHTAGFLHSAVCGHGFQGPFGYQRGLRGREPSSAPHLRSLRRPALHSQAWLLCEPPSYLLVRPQGLGHPVGHHSLIPRHREAAPKAVAGAGAGHSGLEGIRPDHLLYLTERKGRERPLGDGAALWTALASGTAPWPTPLLRASHKHTPTAQLRGHSLPHDAQGGAAGLVWSACPHHPTCTSGTLGLALV